LGREAEEALARPVPVCRPEAGCAVLLAEDEPVNRMAIKAYLEKIGYQAEGVADGAEALRALDHGDFGLVLMDIQMPVMDGLAAIRAIRAGEAGARNADIPIVVLTAFAMSGDRATFMEAGADDYLPKPLDLDRLASVMNRLTAGPRAGGGAV
jgi:CheY-like chemotaxis protein